MSNSPKTGSKMCFYKNTGSVATPTWLLIDEIGDLSISDFTRALAELKRRANQFTKNLPALIQSISVEFRLHHGMDPTTFTDLVSDFLEATAAEYAVMDGPIADAGSQGLRCPYLLESFPWDQPLEDVSGHDIKLATAYMESGGTEVDPSWYVVEEEP